YQRNGVGRELLSFLENHVKELGAHMIFLESELENKPFYEKRGYKQFGFNEKGWFGLNTYQMKKVLQDPREESLYE
ncbi:MAG TPA: GNAT family N-acetyltransferase, partial [Patescibacteria group bacterium]|nr:GNAT family N-acetyltransferase [Patescibacteria group bacterium]